MDGITAAYMKKAGYSVEVVDNLPGLSARIQNRAAFLETDNKDLALRYYYELEALSGSDTFVQLVQKDFD